MRSLRSLFLLFIVGTWVYAEVLDLGDMMQYKPRLNARVDNLRTDSIWVSEIEGGFTLAIGKDLKGKANQVIQDCASGQQIDQKCFQQVVSVLEGAVIQTDKQLDRRGSISALSRLAKTWRTPQGFFFGVAAFLIGMWYENHAIYEGEKIYYPSPAAGKIADLPAATPITVSAKGKPIATMTKPPVPTPTVKGSVTPAVTSVATAGGGFQAGDFAAVLDKDLASRLKDFMPLNKDCRVGSDFDKANPPPSNGGGRGTYGQALCASEAVVISMQQGGPFRDLGQLKSDGVHFQFKAGPAASLTTELAEFIDTYAAMIFPQGRENDRGLRTDLAAFIAVLAIDLLVENLGLSERNLIKAAWVTVGGGSKPGCPNKKSLYCGWLPKRSCSLKFVGQGEQKTAVCSDGDFVDCECVAPLYQIATQVDPGKIKAMADFYAIVAGQKPIGGGGPAPNCPVKITDIPADVFSNPKDKNMNIHNHFCQGWPIFKDEKKTMTVDSKGANVKPEPQKGKKLVVNAVEKRTPPPNPDSFTNYQFDLEFLPSGKGGACSMDCNAAFAKMAGSCAASSPGTYMYESGSLDVGCGRFAYHITKVETAKLIEQPRTCFEIKEYPEAQNRIVEEHVLAMADNFCRRHPDQKVKKADKSTYIQEVYYENPSATLPYQFSIWWKEGCVLENNPLNQQSIHDPLDQKGGQGSIKCMETLLWIHKDCAAKSRLGGNIQLGCLMYEFIPTKKLRVFPDR